MHKVNSRLKETAHTFMANQYRVLLNLNNTPRANKPAN